MVRPGKQKPESDRALERRFEAWARRATKGREQTPDELLAQAQDVLRWSIRKNGPASSFSIKAMNEVANQLAELERVDEELTLREKIVEALRGTVGPEDPSTLRAESKLATCLLTLDRPHAAEPLLAHVVHERLNALGPDDTQTLTAMAWNASATKRLGRLVEARLLQEQVVAGYERRGEAESGQAQSAALNLASTLNELHEQEEAARLVRIVVAVRNRTLGPDDPMTVEAGAFLASVTGAPEDA